MRIIARPATVGLRGLAGDAEITDQGLAGVQLLLVLRDAQRPPCGLQARRIATVEAVKHCVTPLRGRQLLPHVTAQAAPFKGRIVGVFQIFGSGQRGQNIRRDRLTLRHVDYLYRATVKAVGEEQNFKVRATDISLRTRLLQIDA